MERAGKAKAVFCIMLVITALACKLWLPDGAAFAAGLISGSGKDPVTAACIAFRQVVEDGGSLADGLAAFCDGISGNEDET